MDPANNEYVIKIKDVLYVILKKLWLMIIVGLVAGAGLFIYNYKRLRLLNPAMSLIFQKRSMPVNLM